MNTNKIGINDIKEIMLPWHCLVCCGAFIKGNESKLPDRAFEFMNQSFQRFERDFSNSDFEFETYQKQLFVTDRLPNYVAELRDSGRINNANNLNLQVEGIMVINESQ